jgi:hypothetical protein
MKTLGLLIILLTSIISNASSIENQKSVTKGLYYLKFVRMLARMEANDSYRFQDQSSLLMTWLIPDAIASSQQCIIAGYIGVARGHSCKFPSGVNFDRQILCHEI